MSKKTNIENKKVQDEILNLKKTLLNLNFQKFSGQLEKTSQIKRPSKRSISKSRKSMDTPSRRIG